MTRWRGGLADYDDAASKSATSSDFSVTPRGTSTPARRRRSLSALGFSRLRSSLSDPAASPPPPPKPPSLPPPPAQTLPAPLAAALPPPLAVLPPHGDRDLDIEILGDDTSTADPTQASRMAASPPPARPRRRRRRSAWISCSVRRGAAASSASPPLATAVAAHVPEPLCRLPRWRLSDCISSSDRLFTPPMPLPPPLPGGALLVAPRACGSAPRPPRPWPRNERAPTPSTELQLAGAVEAAEL